MDVLIRFHLLLVLGAVLVCVVSSGVLLRSLREHPTAAHVLLTYGSVSPYAGVRSLRLKFFLPWVNPPHVSGISVLAHRAMKVARISAWVAVGAVLSLGLSGLFSVHASNTANHIFTLVSVGRAALPCVVALLPLHFLRWPENRLWRAAFGVALGWLVAVTYAIVAYNPAGIAAATERGIDSPEMRYDNNTVAVALLIGWLLPLVAVSVYVLVLHARRRR